jgi:hypothetical protein
LVLFTAEVLVLVPVTKPPVASSQNPPPIVEDFAFRHPTVSLFHFLSVKEFIRKNTCAKSTGRAAKIVSLRYNSKGMLILSGRREQSYEKRLYLYRPILYECP